MSEDLNFIPTKCSILRKDKPADFIHVEHNSYKKKPKKLKESSEKTNDVKDAERKTNFNRSRYDIIKFGMTGFDTKKKEDVKIQLAVKLGARPPKKKYKNYKQLIEEKKKEKELNEQNQNFHQLGKNKVGKSTAKGKRFDQKRKQIKGSLLDKYGKVKVTS